MISYLEIETCSPVSDKLWISGRAEELEQGILPERSEMVPITIGNIMGAEMKDKEFQTDEVLEVRMHLLTQSISGLAIRTSQISFHCNEQLHATKHPQNRQQEGSTELFQEASNNQIGRPTIVSVKNDPKGMRHRAYSTR